MKIISLLVILLAQTSHAFDITEPDKNLHVGVSYNLTAASNSSFQKLGYSKCNSALMSGGAVFLLGVAKEYFHDKQADPKDIEADAFGALTGMIIPFRIEF